VRHGESVDERSDQLLQPRLAPCYCRAHDTTPRRKAIFKDYDDLDKIKQHQRVGATLVVDGDLRDYFETLAAQAIAVLDEWEADEG
jgi:hypothetical protein